MSKSGGVFQFSGGRMTSRGQCPRGGGACECLHPPPFQEILYPRLYSVPPIQVQTPPPTWMAGYGPGTVICGLVCKYGYETLGGDNESEDGNRWAVKNTRYNVSVTCGQLVTVVDTRWRELPTTRPPPPPPPNAWG